MNISKDNLISLMLFTVIMVYAVLIYLLCIDTDQDKNITQIGEVYGYITEKIEIEDSTNCYLVINNVRYLCNDNIRTFHFINGFKPVLLVFKDNGSFRTGTAIGEYKFKSH